jgi:CBS domain-containing protein
MTRPETAAPPETLDEDPPVTRLMSGHMFGITPDSPLSTALHLMAATGVRHLPVLDGTRCLGLVTEPDLARFVAGGTGDSSTVRATVLVSELARPAEPVPCTARRSDAARRMQAEHVDAVLITDEGRLVGILTATDLVRSLAGAEPGHHHDRTQGQDEDQGFGARS